MTVNLLQMCKNSGLVPQFKSRLLYGEEPSEFFFKYLFSADSEAESKYFCGVEFAVLVLVEILDLEIIGASCAAFNLHVIHQAVELRAGNKAIAVPIISVNHIVGFFHVCFVGRGDCSDSGENCSEFHCVRCLSKLF